MEPRNWLCGSLRLGSSGGRVAARQQAWCVRSCRGRRAGHRHRRVPQERGRPDRFHPRKSRLGDNDAASTSPRPFDVARVVEGSEAHGCGWYRQAKENEARRKGRSGVVTPDSTEEAGALDPTGPGGGKRASGQETVGGKHGGDIGLRGRVHATTTDSDVGEAIAADGIHVPEPVPGSAVAA